jgi:hypothetical protein
LKGGRAGENFFEKTVFFTERAQRELPFFHSQNGS